jgi:hypothetical protein
VDAHRLAALSPLLVLGVAAGALWGLAGRAPDLRRRRLYHALWIAALLAGGPLWIAVAVALGFL